jgi:hypothetical protein
MEQTTLTVITPIRPGMAEPLRHLLNTIGDDIDGAKDNKYIRFSDLSTTHFARWVIIPEDKAKGYKPHLAFESNFDGGLDEYLKDLTRNAGKGLDQIYANCEGYPAGGTGDLEAFGKYIRDHSLKYSARYIAYRGRKVKDIHNNTRLRQKIEEYLDKEDRSHALDGISTAAIRRRIQEFSLQAKAKDTELATKPLKISSLWRQVTLVLLAASALLILFPVPVFWVPLPLVVRLPIFFTPLLLLGIFLFVLRRHERADLQSKVEFVPVEDAIFSRENHQVQNQLTHLVEIKPGRFRLYTLKAVLGVINLAAKFHWYKGDLGGIPTIHFARWVIIDDNKRLLFFSNFDGSWENYLGDFIDKAAVGLTGVWSNAVEFPKTEFLFLKGATDEERFKEWARLKQIPTQVWYSAHPDETVQNILNNFEIRNNIEPTLNEEQTKQWLRRF